MLWRARAATLVVLLGIAIAFAALAPHFQFTTKITDFLPDDHEDRGAQIAALLAESELSRVLVIDLALDEPAPAPDRLRVVARSLVSFLRSQRDVAVARSGFTEEDAAAMIAFLGQWP